MKRSIVNFAIKFGLTLLVSTLWFGSLEAKEVLVPVDNYPPFHIFSDDRENAFGEVISVLEAVIQEVNKEGGFDLILKTTKDTPFKRCLHMMKKGDAQLIGGLLDKDDRREYMHLLKYKPNSNKVFLIRSSWDKDIHGLADLSGKKVGVVSGFKYFKEFDKDESIIKDEAPRFDLSIRKLVGNRFDVVIATENEWLALKEKDPELSKQVKLATYKYDKPNPVYLGISKNSWLAEEQYLTVFTKVVDRMYLTNEFVKVIADFYESYSKQN